MSDELPLSFWRGKGGVGVKAHFRGQVLHCNIRWIHVALYPQCFRSDPASVLGGMLLYALLDLCADLSLRHA